MARSKTFGGKVYSYHGGYRYKGMANTVAARLRREGKLARVVDTAGGSGYEVYTRSGASRGGALRRTGRGIDQLTRPITP